MYKGVEENGGKLLRDSMVEGFPTATLREVLHGLNKLTGTVESRFHVADEV